MYTNLILLRFSCRGPPLNLTYVHYEPSLDKLKIESDADRNKHVILYFEMIKPSNCLTFNSFLSTFLCPAQELTFRGEFTFI